MPTTDVLRDLLAKDATPDAHWETFVQESQENLQHNRPALLVAARVLRFLRERALTKAWLAERMEVSPQHVGKILKGRSNMTLETIAKLEEATGLALIEVPSASSQQARIRAATTFSGTLNGAAEYLESARVNPADPVLSVG